MSKKYGIEDIKKVIGEPNSHRNTDWDDKAYFWNVGDGEVSCYTLLNNEPMDIADVFPLGLEMDNMQGEVENMEQLIELRDTGTLKDWE